jgi:hypothetical protein
MIAWISFESQAQASYGNVHELTVSAWIAAFDVDALLKASQNQTRQNPLHDAAKPIHRLAYQTLLSVRSGRCVLVLADFRQIPSAAGFERYVSLSGRSSRTFLLPS